MSDLRKDKKSWLKQAIRLGGEGVDLCYSINCQYRKLNEDFICSDCVQGFRKIPGRPTEYFNENYVHGKGSC